MRDRLVTVVTATSHGIWWWCACYGSTHLKEGGTSIFTKMSTLSSSSWLQDLLVVYPVQWTLCKQFGVEKKYLCTYQKQFWTQGVSVLDLRCWSDYRCLLTVILPKAILKISALCSTLWFRQAHRYYCLSWQKCGWEWWSFHSTAMFECNSVLRCY